MWERVLLGVVVQHYWQVWLDKYCSGISICSLSSTCYLEMGLLICYQSVICCSITSHGFNHSDTPNISKSRHPSVFCFCSCVIEILHVKKNIPLKL